MLIGKLKKREEIKRRKEKLITLSLMAEYIKFGPKCIKSSKFLRKILYQYLLFQ